MDHLSPLRSCFTSISQELVQESLKVSQNALKRRGSSRDGRGRGPNPPILSRLRQCLFFALSSPDCESSGSFWVRRQEHADVEFQGAFFKLCNSKNSSGYDREKVEKHVFLPLFVEIGPISPTQHEVTVPPGDSFVAETILNKIAYFVRPQISPISGHFLFSEKKKSILFLVSAGSLIKKFYGEQSTRGFRSFFQRKESHKILQTGS